MVQIAGTYQFVKTENMEAFFAKLGLDPARIEAAMQDKSNAVITSEGSTINMKTDSVAFSFPVNKEYPDTLMEIDVTTKTVSAGDTFSVTSTLPDGLTLTRVFTFSDSGVVCTYSGTKVGNIQSKRIYKRI